ncbi:hypothetical protein [Luteimonas sp. TWI1416]|uniref:hypothetical protein n=1 Tax=unclassified Luteimonas TaxID=2629088 RepID=UPI003208CB37
MNQSQFFITRLDVTGPSRLALAFADGQRFDVELGDVIARHPALAPVADPAVFAQAALDEWQRGIVFAGDEDLGLASDNLRALAIEQAGGFSHQQLLAWMSHHGLTLEAAAHALDISRRMLAYYRSGAKPIPRTVGLAMLGWETMRANDMRHAFDYGQAA